MSTALAILAFVENFSLYFTIGILVIGGIGNLGNLYVLTTLKLFRSNQCAFYLIVESIVDTCQLSVIFVIYLLPITNEFDPGNVFVAWCKLKNILPQIFRLLSTSMVCFAAVDQFISTNPQFAIRKMSTLQLAHRLTCIAICLWAVHSIPYSIFYQIDPKNGCINTSFELIRYYSFFYYPFLHGVLPIFVSSLFSILAYRNVRHLVRRRLPVVRRRLDRQLTAMIFIRVIFFMLFSLPYTVYRIYSLNVTVTQANLHPYAIDRLIYSIVSSISNLNYTMSFYIFLASSSRYRRQVKYSFVKKFRQSLRYLFHSCQTAVHPVNGTSVFSGHESE